MQSQNSAELQAILPVAPCYFFDSGICFQLLSAYLLLVSDGAQHFANSHIPMCSMVLVDNVGAIVNSHVSDINKGLSVVAYVQLSRTVAFTSLTCGPTVKESPGMRLLRIVA